VSPPSRTESQQSAEDRDRSPSTRYFSIKKQRNKSSTATLLLAAYNLGREEVTGAAEKVNAGNVRPKLLETKIWRENAYS
jgi:GH24 family phage-related lysozyme (muramidase)